MLHHDLFSNYYIEHCNLFAELHNVEPQIIEAGIIAAEALRKGNKILICGNGGSASDAQHLAAELVGRFEMQRKALPGIALTTDTSVLTAIGNDFGYDTIFSRQIEALGEEGDVFIGISTSGNSKNVLLANTAAKKIGLKTIGLFGHDGGKLSSKMDLSIVIPHNNTARIQETHIFIIHFWASLVEKALFGKLDK